MSEISQVMLGVSQCQYYVLHNRALKGYFRPTHVLAGVSLVVKRLGTADKEFCLTAACTSTDRIRLPYRCADRSEPGGKAGVSC
jgi:hypothetical protein